MNTNVTVNVHDTDPELFDALGRVFGVTTSEDGSVSWIDFSNGKGHVQFFRRHDDQAPPLEQDAEQVRGPVAEPVFAEAL